ncbi:MAG: hypothetical protein LBD46_00245 [Endomicrobium sp.]|nr:hypothetical protein [Endomicrobium sp.]
MLLDDVNFLISIQASLIDSVKPVPKSSVINRLYFSGGGGGVSVFFKKACITSYICTKNI